MEIKYDPLENLIEFEEEQTEEEIQELMEDYPY